MQLTRFQLGRYIRIITGHNNLLYHRSNINPDINPMCRFCNETQETFIHFISDCPALWQEQQQLMAEIREGPLHLADPTILLGFANNRCINAAIESEEYVNRIWELEQSEATESDADTVDNMSYDSEHITDNDMEQ